MDKDVILLLDEMYLKKDVLYHQVQLLGTDQDGNLYKSIVTFMIVGLRKNITFVVRAVPESKIEGKWLSQHIDECLKSLHQVGFEVHAVISDNHATNVAAFRDLFSKYGHSKLANAITHPSLSSLTTYLFFDSVYILKNIRNNLLNSKEVSVSRISIKFYYCSSWRYFLEANS